jgi:glycolate oxidase iron-sulfur subunit
VQLLRRHGCEVVIARGAGCCGALAHHMGLHGPALAYARANIDAWERIIDDGAAAGGLDAIVVNASGCGTQLKDYGFMLREDPAYAEKAQRISGLTRDVSELMAELGLATPVQATGRRVAYHAACSLQHGQRVRTEPKALLAAAGFTVLDVPEGHLCCGSAGTYNLLQPELATRLRDRKLGNIESLDPDIVATGNIGCMTQLAAGTAVPVVHTVELLDWATGGALPAGMRGIGSR